MAKFDVDWGLVRGINSRPDNALTAVFGSKDFDALLLAVLVIDFFVWCQKVHSNNVSSLITYRTLALKGM